MAELPESPKYLQTSLAAALSLGLQKGHFYRNAKLYCLNLLLTYADGCRARCSYCGLAHQRKVTHGAKTFIRVSWPTYDLETILARLSTYPHHFQRLCLSMVTHPRAVSDSVALIRRFKAETDLLISALIAPSAMVNPPNDLMMLKEAGADMCGIAIDAATPELFTKHRGTGVGGPHQWERFWDTVKFAVEIFGPFKAGVHLIVGLGETEEEMVRTICRAQELGAHTHLFSFFPEAGSLLGNQTQPPLGQYRRVQLARYLINECGVSLSQISFDEKGKITGYDYEIGPVIQAGEAFMTSGCPGKTCRYSCNRPYGNERPSAAIRNFPFAPEPEDIEEIWEQLKWQ